MYQKYLQQIEEAGKIRNLKQRTIDGYKSYVSYFLKYMNKIQKNSPVKMSGSFFSAKKMKDSKQLL